MKSCHFLRETVRVIPTQEWRSCARRLSPLSHESSECGLRTAKLDDYEVLEITVP